MTLHTGRHFLQIPGPTNVPDRVLRAMDMPPLDHRGAEFAELGYAVMAGMQPPANQPGQAIGPPQPSMNHLQQTLATLKGGGGAAG